ncbi:hypothetical protein [Flagellimonas meishanensis]|uniref:hypothetical protein n=1 Tax=Flagellimonas meishanensis TaxID=2873264 RepID=UPI001CA723E0|nr:hypothetical protein [[Muricauda] meishanensis]
MIDIYKYIFEIPLYQKVELQSDDKISEIEEFINGSFKIDAYNPSLKENTTYQVSTVPKRKQFTQLGTYTDYYTHSIKCVRTGEEFRAYSFFNGDAGTLQKIGQFKSIADFHISQIKQYKSVLSKEKLKEFTRAIGLAANGVGIGSFVYLRRVFETLLEEAHQKAQKGEGWNEEDYANSRVSERIKLLESFLPSFLVENKELYGIMSKGVHNLEENECLAYYDTVKSGIEIILDEKVEELEKLEKIEKAKKQIAALNSKLK